VIKCIAAFRDAEAGHPEQFVLLLLAAFTECVSFRLERAIWESSADVVRVHCGRHRKIPGNFVGSANGRSCGLDYPADQHERDHHL
jgi:hypothetical protein